MMAKRIAIPVEDGKLCPHFGHCQAFAFVDVENDVITNVSILDPPEHQPGTFPRFVAARGATVVIAGGMGPQAIMLFNEAGVDVFIGATADSPEKLVHDFIHGNLQLSANYCDRDSDDHEHRHHKH